MNTQVDTRGANLKISTFWAEMKKSMPSILRRLGRLTCVSLARSTEPSGEAAGNVAGRDEIYHGDADRVTMENKVERDIRKVYADGGNVFASIRATSKSADNRGLADAFYYFYQTGQIKGRRGAQSLLEASSSVMAGLKISKLDPEIHRGQRNSKGRVPGQRSIGRFRQIVKNSDEIKKYVARRIKKVGFVKAGWAAAARALGGTRGIPKWVIRHRGAPGIGQDNTNRETSPHVVIQNLVAYASEVLPAYRHAEALKIAEGRLLKSIETAKAAAVARANAKKL